MALISCMAWMFALIAVSSNQGTHAGLQRKIGLSDSSLSNVLMTGLTLASS